MSLGEGNSRAGCRWGAATVPKKRLKRESSDFAWHQRLFGSSMVMVFTRSFYTAKCSCQWIAHVALRITSRKSFSVPMIIGDLNVKGVRKLGLGIRNRNKAKGDGTVDMWPGSCIFLLQCIPRDSHYTRTSCDSVMHLFCNRFVLSEALTTSQQNNHCPSQQHCHQLCKETQTVSVSTWTELARRRLACIENDVSFCVSLQESTSAGTNVPANKREPSDRLEEDRQHCQGYTE